MPAMLLLYIVYFKCTSPTKLIKTSGGCTTEILNRSVLVLSIVRNNHILLRIQGTELPPTSHYL